MKNLAILDFGSNSTRLAIIELDDAGSFKEVKRQKVMTRLAEGMGQIEGSPILQETAIKRTLEALTQFKAEYEQYPNLIVKAIATAAVRCAKNSATFVQQVKDLTGVEIEILSGQAEAYYDYLGVINTLDVSDCLLCDMGGGSFELCLIKDKKLSDSISIPYGAVSLSEKFNAKDKITAQDLFQLQRFVQYKFNQLPWLKNGTGLPLVLLGGANRTVARQQLERLGEPLTDFMHGVKMSAYSFQEIYSSWLGMSLAERQKELAEEANRADIIIGGLTPISYLIQVNEVPEIIFSESGVREGIIYSMIAD
ncbi:Ppx/GppA family phosphatase [Ligilactobacillus sp. Marseille-Q7487]|uniref:Ppx/GppA family phosphatase n=1 Tax=Ligilactobacillus sp. Marseille-Q7487 TaxID=3022128 RepID=UPI0024A91A5F|nr:Ppx/GppA family phosphatase [Ligilactobacillus sp. Marseille-Q7487]